MGPVEDSTRSGEDRKHGAAGLRRPRTRLCLLKGCEQPFRPPQSRMRYCSEACRRAARKWSRWKAQQSYRATRAGKDKRNQQSRRYRERVRKGRAGEERRREGNHSKLFLTTPAIAPAATRDLFISGEVPRSASVRAPAAAPWNEFCSANDAGIHPPISRTY